jgi:hypothetical protein
MIIVGDICLMKKENKGTYFRSGGEQLVRPMRGVRVTLPRPDCEYSVSVTEQLLT